MDATQADIYLVSRSDRSVVVGRPYIYMAVDTATHLIVGVYVGYSCDETAVMACIEQAVMDKVEYCAQYGIKITREQWPSVGMPTEIITDQGREFFGPRIGELCKRYGLEVLTLPPFRPDFKGTLEKSIDLLQQRYKPMQRGRGVIEDDAQERWATDYRTQAMLDLDDFTRIVIHSVLHLNSGRLVDGNTPAERWLELSPRLMTVDPRELHIQTLPRDTAKLTRKGIRINHMWYAPDDVTGLAIGESYTIAYDPAALCRIHIILADRICQCHAVEIGQPVSVYEVDAGFTFPSYQAADIPKLSRQSLPRDFKGMIKAILEVEAPLSEELLLRRIVWLFDREKVTKVVWQAYEQQMYGYQRYGIIRRIGFLYLEAGREIQFRALGDIERDIKRIAPEELAARMLEILKQNVTADKAGLYRSLVLQCGVNRVGKAISEALDSAPLLLKDSIAIDGDQLSLK